MIGSVRTLFGHVDERRLAAIAESSGVELPVQARGHLDACRRCSALLVGHERTLALLGAPWAERAIPSTERPPAGAPAGTRRFRSVVKPLAGVAITLVVVASIGLGLLGFVGAGPVGPGGPAAVLDLGRVPGCIAYSTGPRLGPFRIHVSDLDGGNAHVLGNGRMETSPSWSPDGKRLAYSVRTDVPQERDDLWVSDADGSHATRISDRLVDGPSWSPDGSWIAFVDHGSPNADIFLIHPDGTGLRQLSAFSNMTLAQPWLSQHPSGGIGWSPDSRTIATGVTVTDQQGTPHGQLWAWDVATGAQRVISTGFLEDASDPAWSPDGSRIVFSAMQLPGQVDLWSMPAQGGPLERVAMLDGTAESGATWSPDGKYLAFESSTQDQKSDISVLRLSDGAIANLTHNAAETFTSSPAWCPASS